MCVRVHFHFYGCVLATFYCCQAGHVIQRNFDSNFDESLDETFENCFAKNRAMCIFLRSGVESSYYCVVHATKVWRFLKALLCSKASQLTAFDHLTSTTGASDGTIVDNGVLSKKKWTYFSSARLLKNTDETKSRTRPSTAFVLFWCCLAFRLAQNYVNGLPRLKLTFFQETRCTGIPHKKTHSMLAEKAYQNTRTLFSYDSADKTAFSCSQH